MYDENGLSVHEEVFGWTNPETRWWDRPQLALKSPLALACRYSSEPFWCNADGAHGTVANAELSRISFKRFFDTTPRLNALLMIPSRLTFGRIGAAAFCPLDEDETDLSEIHASHAPFLSAVIGRFLGTYALIQEQSICPVSSDISLSRREVQCLFWASRGKTDAETAIILGVSHAAVRYHVTRAAEKLDCVNRAQAIFKAGQLGYLASI